MNDRLVIIPTYNEKENIENIIRCVFSLKPAFDILIIEDNSPDGTAGIVKTLQKEFTNLHIIDMMPQPVLSVIPGKYWKQSIWTRSVLKVMLSRSR